MVTENPKVYTMEDVVNRFRQWKFTQAYEASENLMFNAEHEGIADIIKNLSIMFGDCGWFGGTMGELLDRVVELCCTVLEGGKL